MITIKRYQTENDRIDISMSLYSITVSLEEC